MIGSRGGGKTDAGMAWLTKYVDHPMYRALILRKNYEDLSDWLDRARSFYKRYGVTIVGKPAEVRWPSGAMFRLGHLKDMASIDKYLGHEYQRILVEELTLIPTEDIYNRILGSCRSTKEELRPQIFNTTNPGSVGHAWVAKRFKN